GRCPFPQSRSDTAHPIERLRVRDRSPRSADRRAGPFPQASVLLTRSPNEAEPHRFEPFVTTRTSQKARPHADAAQASLKKRSGSRRGERRRAAVESRTPAIRAQALSSFPTSDSVNDAPIYL